ncbi:MAG: YjfB family protein [Thermoanaerobacterium thermosaccharolyticum]
MDIAALSMAMSQFNVSTAVNTSLMKKALDDGTENAVQMIQSINQASNTNVGTKLDVMA